MIILWLNPHILVASKTHLLSQFPFHPNSLGAKVSFLLVNNLNFHLTPEKIKELQIRNCIG